MRIASALLVTLGLLSLQGCIVVAAAAVAGAVGYVQYDKNEAFRDFDYSLERTWEATLHSIDELGFTELEIQELTPTEGEISNETMWTRVERHTDDRARVRVRVGTFDNEDNRRRATLILETIAAKLDD